MFCIPIIASSTEEVIRKMSIAARLADVFEVRLDLMESFDIPLIIKASEKPALITYRSIWEGGMGKDSPDKVAGYLISAIESGAELVDVELSMPQDQRNRVINSGGGSKIVVSTHITAGTPSDTELERILDESVEAGGDIVKIVTMAGTWDDNLRVLDLVHKAKENDISIISFCMGPLGRMSRVFSELMGAFMTFASLEPGQESASGQIPIEKMKELVEFFSE
jgi:3-dehydroquinate dehydratase type I